MPTSFIKELIDPAGIESTGCSPNHMFAILANTAAGSCGIPWPDCGDHHGDLNHFSQSAPQTGGLDVLICSLLLKGSITRLRPRTRAATTTGKVVPNEGVARSIAPAADAAGWQRRA